MSTEVLVHVFLPGVCFGLGLASLLGAWFETWLEEEKRWKIIVLFLVFAIGLLLVAVAMVDWTLVDGYEFSLLMLVLVTIVVSAVTLYRIEMKERARLWGL